MERRGFLAFLLAPVVAPLCPLKHGDIVLPIDMLAFGRVATRGVVVGGPTTVLMGEAGADVSCPVSALFGPLGDQIAARVRGVP